MGCGKDGDAPKPPATLFASVDHTLHRFNYGQSLDWKGFCGGGDVYSYWMEKADILAALARFGSARRARSRRQMSTELP